MPNTIDVRISPSDFAYLWDECPRCWWLKARAGILRPREGMPAIFNVIDGLMKNSIGRAELASVGIIGDVHSRQRKVTSSPHIIVAKNGTPISIVVSGFYDTVIQCDDGTFGTCDYKTTKSKPDHPIRYRPQLNSYAFAMKYPAKAEPVDVTKGWLLCFEPDTATGIPQDDPRLVLQGGLTRMDVDIDLEWYYGLLCEVAELASQESAPDPGDKCSYCSHASAVLGYAKQCRELAGVGA